MDAYNVTNAQFLKFMAAGGYEDRASGMWTPGMDPVGSDPAPEVLATTERRPWWIRTMFAEIPLPLVMAGLCQSRRSDGIRAVGGGVRCPAKAQFHRAAFGTPDRTRSDSIPWGSCAAVARAW